MDRSNMNYCYDCIIPMTVKHYFSMCKFSRANIVFGCYHVCHILCGGSIGCVGDLYKYIDRKIL